MKLNKISMMLAAAALVSCSDDLGERFTDQTLEDSRLIELGSNFVLSGVGQEGATTRTHWDNDGGNLVNVFLPTYGNPAPSSGDNLGTSDKVVLEKVGLCWLGQLGGENVYTNYEFYHFGWLNNDETEADVQCAELVNGAWYTDLKLTADGTADEEAKVSDLAYVTGPGTPSDDLNLNSGVYKTDNKSIFGGDYIVYYPFNADFKEAGTIPAIAQTKFNNAPTSYDDLALGKATFRYSGKTSINGGDQAAGFGMKNLSSLVRVNVLSGDCGDDIDQIVLYSENSELLAQANLAADKIVAGAEGQALYASTEGTKTVVANFTAAAITNAKSTTAKVFITALPTTVENLVVLVHNSTHSTWARVDMGETEIPAGSAMVLNVEVEAADFNTDYIAVDEASLSTALKEARLVASATTPQTITVIGDIELSTTTYSSPAPNPRLINDAADAYITIQGDAIIVPEDVTLTVNTNMLSDIKVLGKSCCDGNDGGKLVVEGGLISNVTMVETEAKATTDALYDQYNPTLTYQTNAATVAAGSKVDVQAGNVVVNAIVSHKADFVVAEDAKVVVNATGGLNFMGATVENNGTIEVMKQGKFDMTDADGNATASDGENMTNNGKFIHNVDAAVGTAVQAMKMGENGEYRCRVDKQEKLTDAYHQWTACSVIEMVNTTAVSYNLGTAAKIATNPTAKTAPYKHNNKFIDIEVKSTSASILTTFDNAADGNEDIQIGNLTSNTKLVINFNGSSKKRTLTVNGDMTVNANTDLKSSNKINVKGNLAVNNSATLYYRAADGGLAVTYDITVDGGMFDAAPKDVLNITCANFYLKNAATAVFGNRTSGETKTMTVTGTISNPAGCTFKQIAATDPNLLAWITCTTLKVGGEFPGGQPKVVN